MKRVIKRTTAVLLAVIILSIPITVMQAAAASQGKASSDSALGKPAYEEVFVSESGSLADSSDGSYVGIPSKSYEPGQTFEGITVDDSNKMKDVDGEEIGTHSDQMTGKVSEEELAAPRALTHLRGTNDSAQQSIEINDFRAVVRSGAVRNADGDYVWTAPNSDHAFTYRIIYSFSGEGEYDRGQIQMTIPKTILRDRSGEYADVFDVAVPEENEGGLTDQNLFVYRVEGDKIVIYNRIGCVAAQNGFIEVSYKTSKSTFDYADYKSTTSANTNPKAGSDPFQASIEINRGDEHLSGESASVPVYIDTTAKLNSLNKNAPDSAYSSWSAAWGDAVKPANPGDYEYLVWTVRTEASCTQPYNLIYEDTFNQDDAMLLGYSVNKSDFSSSLTRTNIRSNYETAYVLTAHKKSAYNALLDSEGRYKIDNAIKVTLVPFDEVDGSSMRNASASYVKEAAHFTPPSGHFYAYKYGYDVSDRIVYSSDQIRDYSLIEFNGDSGATIGDLKYYADVYGYSYPWTLQDGVDAATVASDPEAYYGQIPVTYRLSDNTFYLKEISDEEYSDKLTAADYELEYIQMYIYEEAATYNDDTKQFNVRTLNSYSQSDIDNHYDIIEIYAEVGGSGGYKKVADYSLSTKQYTYTEDADAIVDKTKTSGMNVYFKGNVIGYRLETTNAYWYTELGAYPYAKLKHSDTVDSYVQKAIGEDSVSKLCLKNQADSEVLRQNSKILGFTREGVDYITGKVKNSKLTKNFVGSTNSKKKREYTVTWDTSVSENYSDNDGSHAIPQQSGVFYDLLPDGAAFKKESLYVYASGAALEAWKYTVNVDENYKGSGRTLLTIRINESGNNYRFRYSTVHSWNSITDFGNNLLNTVAYETGNALIAKGKTTADTSGITEKELMKNLDPSAGDAKRFLYTQAAHTADIILAANLGLEKAVRSGDDTSYSGTAQVNSGGSYSYNVRFATDDASRAKNLIAFDSLENHTVVSGADSGRSSDWHGTLKSVDTHQLTAMGIAPKVYYSTVDKLNIEQNHDLSETSVWTLSSDFTGDLSTVKAIAVDMRKATDGSDFVLPEDKAVQFTIHMTAPKGVNNDSLLPKAYNNIYLNNILIDGTNGNEYDEKLIHQDYTEVLLKIAADLELLKVSRDNHAVVAPGIKFSLIGESDYGTSVDEILSTGENGRITRNNLEKGTYTLVEEDTTADFFKNDTRFTVIVDNKGKVTINGSEDTAPYIIEDPPRVHGRLDLMKKGKIDGETQTKQLYGAQFTIEGDSYYGNHIVLTEESKDGGIVSFPDIERGTYELTETRAANGYITTKEKYRVVCDRYGVVTLEHFENEAWAEVTNIENGYPVILNEPLHSLRLVKYDEVNNKLLGGAEFRLTGTSAYGTYVDITKETETSGSYEGTVLFDGLEPGNQYTLKETKAPDHYQLDDTLRTVTISPEGEVTVTGLTKMPPDWQGGFYADCFGVPNTRAYEGEITITKRWLDADGRPITDSSDLPIPVVHVDTSEPKIDLPPQDAYLDKSKFRSALSGATTFKKTQESYTISTLPAGAIKVDDGTTRASIYVWKDGTDAYWWTDAATAHLPNDSSSLFYQQGILTDIDLSGFDTSNVTDMSRMFELCESLTELDLSSFDTGNVTNMRRMFFDCESLTSLDLSSFDTGNVTNMYGMFISCRSLTSLDLGDKFDTGSVEDMSQMFCFCSSLTTLDLSSFNTRKVTNMYDMFEACTALTSLDLSGWNTGSVTEMNYMFRFCSSLETVYVSECWSTAKAIYSSGMFEYCSSKLAGGAGTHWKRYYTPTDKTYARIDNPPDEPGYFTYKANILEEGTDNAYLFYGNAFVDFLSGATSIKKTTEQLTLDQVKAKNNVKKVDDGTTRASIYMWKEGSDVYWWTDAGTAHLPNDSSYLFDNNTTLTYVDLSGFDTSNVTHMGSMFNMCSSLTTLDLGDKFDTGNVTDMSLMFSTCRFLTTLDLGDKFDTGNVTNMRYMFYSCNKLTTLDLGDKFDTGNVKDMSWMFFDCYSLTSNGLKLGDHFDTGNVTDMSYMFYNCNKLTTLDLGDKFDTGNVINMNSMFSYCSSLTSLDLSSFDTGNVASMRGMFSYCSSLETVYVSERWSTANVVPAYYGMGMFEYCSSKLAGGAGTHWNYSNPTDKTYARIDDPSNNKPGYFTYKAYVPPTGNKDDEPVGATPNNVLGGLINKLVSAVFGDSSAENSQAAPEIKTVKKPEMMAAVRPLIPAALQLKSDGALGAGDGTDTNTVTFSQTTNSVLTRNSDDAEGKWLDNRDGTWTYRMKVFDADAKYYVWEEPIPGFSCDLDNDTGYTVINYPSQKNAIITNTRTTTNTCSLTLKKVLTGNASDYPEYDLAGMDYHFNVKLRGEGVAGEKVFGYTKFNNGEATVTLKAGEQMTFTNIPRNVTYTVTEQEENYKGAIVTTYSPSGTLTENNSDVTFTVTNAIKDKKSLNIKKTVLPYDGGELDDEDRARVFTFNVDLHADINGLYGELIFAGGKATAYLKHGETVSITGLPDTVGSYTVTEAESALYTCDQPTQSGELIGKETSIEFKNTKIPEEERYTGSFTLKKLINGKTTTDNEFAFNIAMSKLDKNAVYTLSNGTQFTTDQNGTVNLSLTLKHGDSVTFSDLPVGAEYTVSEQACNYTASYAITGTERVVPLTAENTETDKQLTTSKITVQKDDDITITYTNTDKRYDVFIAKVIEVEKGYELLEGAELQIIEKDNESNVIETWTTTDEQHKSEVPQGTYILREVTAPFGYMKAPDIVFTVDDQGHVFLEGSTDETAELKMVDKPVELAVTGAGGVIPVAVSASITFVILLAAVVIKNRKNNIKEKRSTTK